MRGCCANQRVFAGWDSGCGRGTSDRKGIKHDTACYLENVFGAVSVEEGEAAEAWIWVESPTELRSSSPSFFFYFFFFSTFLLPSPPRLFLFSRAERPEYVL